MTEHAFKKEQPFKRTDRVADLLRKIVSEVFATRFHHENFDQITVTEVKVTPDLKSALVYYRLLDPSRRSEMMKTIQEKAKQIQREVGSQLKLRSTPHLKFTYDESIDYGDRIEQLFVKIHENDEKDSEGE